MLLTLSFFSLIFFVLIELWGKDPMLDLRLLANRTFLLSVVVGGTINIGLFGGVFLIPIFTQNLLGLSPFKLDCCFSGGPGLRLDDACQRSAF
jgi:hypothetical protein